MQNRTVISKDYSVDVNNENGFVRQIEVFFDTYEEAEYFVEHYEEPLNDGEYLNIICIEYNENGDEIGFHTVC